MLIRDSFCSYCGTRYPEPLAYPRTCPGCKTQVWANRVLLFSTASPIAVSALPAFHQDAETSERGLVFGPDGLDEVFAFPLHVEAARRYFAARGITGAHAFAAY